MQICEPLPGVVHERGQVRHASVRLYEDGAGADYMAGSAPARRAAQKNGNYIDGHFTAEAIGERRWARYLLSAFAKDKPNG